MLLLEFKAKR